MSKLLDPDQNQCSVGPDLGPKLFATVISRRQKLPLSKDRVNPENVDVASTAFRLYSSKYMIGVKYIILHVFLFKKISQKFY